MADNGQQQSTPAALQAFQTMQQHAQQAGFNPQASFPPAQFQYPPGGGLQPHHAEHLRNFWQEQLEEVHQVPCDPAEFKNHQLPLARIKKIMKSDEDVRMISAEAPVLFAKACELFILELTLRSWYHAEENKRRTLQRNDVAAAIFRTDIFDFLIDIIPQDCLKPEGGEGMATGPVVTPGSGGGPSAPPPPPIGAGSGSAAGPSGAGGPPGIPPLPPGMFGFPFPMPGAGGSGQPSNMPGIDPAAMMAYMQQMAAGAGWPGGMPGAPGGQDAGGQASDGNAS